MVWKVVAKMERSSNSSFSISWLCPTTNDFKSTDPLVPRQHIQHFKITADNSFNLGRNRVTLNVAYQRNQRQEFGNILDPEEKNLYFSAYTIFNNSALITYNPGYISIHIAQKSLLMFICTTYYYIRTKLIGIV